MNKTPLVFCCLLLLSMQRTSAQSAYIGAIGETRESELNRSDPFSDNRYYKARKFALKKGQGVLFTMSSTEFKPYIVLSSAAGASVMGKLNEAGTQSRITYIAEADTSFFLVHTTGEENKTGKYSFSYKTLDASQLHFDENFSVCDRLYYLINQWFLEWELIPQHTEMHPNPNDPGGPLVETIKTKTTYLKGNEGIINNGYEELLYSMPKDPDGSFRQYYDQVCSEIKECLNPVEWVVETKTERANPLYVFDSEITSFTFQEGNKKYPCFRVILKKPVLSSLSKTTPDYYYQVLLRF